MAKWLKSIPQYSHTIVVAVALTQSQVKKFTAKGKKFGSLTWTASQVSNKAPSIQVT